MDEPEAITANVDLTIALASLLIRNGTIQAADLLEMAKHMDEGGQHLVHCAIVGAHLPEAVEEGAQQARSGFRVIHGGQDEAP